MYLPLLYTFALGREKIDADISNKIMRYNGGKSYIVFNTHELPLIIVPDRKLKCITCNHFEHFSRSGVRCDIFLYKKCAENYNEVVVKKVSKISDTNYDPKAITLLQITVVIPFPYPIHHNHTDSESESDLKK